MRRFAEPLNALDEQRSESILERSRWRFVAGDQGAEGRPAHQAPTPLRLSMPSSTSWAASRETVDRGARCDVRFTHTERFVGGGDELKEEERALDGGRR